jgi:hypothetical protein
MAATSRSVDPQKETRLRVMVSVFRYCMPCIFKGSDTSMEALTRMARGWESKSIESQQADRDAAKAAAARPPVSAEDAARAARRQTCQMALARAEADLKTATHAAHRQMLEAAIVALTAQLAGE